MVAPLNILNAEAPYTGILGSPIFIAIEEKSFSSHGALTGVTIDCHRGNFDFFTLSVAVRLS